MRICHVVLRDKEATWFLRAATCTCHDLHDYGSVQTRDTRLRYLYRFANVSAKIPRASGNRGETGSLPSFAPSGNRPRHVPFLLSTFLFFLFPYSIFTLLRPRRERELALQREIRLISRLRSHVRRVSCN